MGAKVGQARAPAFILSEMEALGGSSAGRDAWPMFKRSLTTRMACCVDLEVSHDRLCKSLGGKEEGWGDELSC